MEALSISVGYPDEDILRRVTGYLSTRHFPNFRELDVEVDQGSVTVSGRLPSYYEKQVAINTCQRVAGVIELIDEIVVEHSL